MFVVLILISSIITINNNAFAKQSPSDKKAESVIKKTFDKFTGKDQQYGQICTLLVTTKTNSSQQLVYSRNSTSCITPIPPTPIPPTPTAIPALNKTTTFRMAAFGDIDSNSGLTTQLDLMKKHQVQALTVDGDFSYTSSKVVLDNLVAHGFTKDNTNIAVGNHDNCGTVKAWMGKDICYYTQYLTSKIAVTTIDANSQFDCSGIQFQTVKSDLEGNAWYKLVNIHQPFATVKSDHAPNGFFDCYNTVFKANGVSAVLQGHNHNFQRFLIDNILYGVFGTGTHDIGSSMYPLNSKDFNGNQCLKCVTGTNGFVILDFKINDPQHRLINGYFVSNADKLVDQWQQ